MGCSTGGCSTESGGCNKVNTFNWLADIPVVSGNSFKIIEVSFKGGARKDFFRNDNALDLYKGDIVVVKATQGYDIGEVSLSGELVKMQMKKKKVKDDDEILAILRNANEAEVDQLAELRARENEIMKMARVIARDMKLDMKIGDVEFQGDGKKVTFYYTSESRVDFRELVKKYVSEFKAKIEMRQIGARQEAQRLGGVGSCGRELCCSSFLTEFKSVTTGAARYQQLSINSDKLSGQCGRLKCCLNYELDTYVEAFKIIPKKADKLKTKEGTAYLRKTDIFKMEMTFNINKTNKYYKLNVADVKKVQQMNKKGEIPESLENFNIADAPKNKETEYDDLVGQVKLKALVKKPKKKMPSRNNNNNRRKKSSKHSNNNEASNS
tara:strand:+ start:2143 stop:3285 length:1143 start_codon:yes stop_codon:yes gene_type:complete